MRVMRPPFDDTPDARPLTPGEAPRWEAALALVERDLRATLPEHGGLRLLAMPSGQDDFPELVYVALADGSWWGNGFEPDPSVSALDALAVVAEAAQDTVSERLWRAWPVCAAHGLGMHVGGTDERVEWWCSGGSDGSDGSGTGHVRSGVGELADVQPLPPGRGSGRYGHRASR